VSIFCLSSADIPLSRCIFSNSKKEGRGAVFAKTPRQKVRDILTTVQSFYETEDMPLARIVFSNFKDGREGGRYLLKLRVQRSVAI